MATNRKDISHIGRVVSVDNDTIQVEVEVGEACGACAVRKSCAMSGEMGTRIIDVRATAGESFAVGDSVVVSAHRRVGLLAVVLGYVCPLIILVGVLAIMIGLGGKEGPSAVTALCSTSLYYLLLATQRDKISSKISFTISKR